MGTYKQSAEELAEVINAALDISEGDFDISELEKAFEIVKAAQQSVQADGACTCAKNPIIKPVNGVCPVCNGTPRR